MDAMQPVTTCANQVLVQVGQYADTFYLVQKGVFLQTQQDKPTVCMTSGDAYGDVALMYPAPSQVTIQALTSGVMWTIDRTTYRSIITDMTMRKRQQMSEWLAQHPCFCTLFPEERDLVIDELVCVNVASGETILQRGQACDDVYIVQQGTCSVVVYDQVNGKVSRSVLGVNQYFSDDMYEHAASVVAVGDVKMVALSKQFVSQLFGTLEDEE
jgi:cAMP-dependent protein kinase regulator